MPDKYRRYFLRAKDADVLLSGVSERLRVNLKGLFEGGVEVVEVEFGEVFLVGGKPVLARVEGEVFPALVFGEFLASAPRVVVDMGAVPHVCNGADVMAPGVRRYEGDFKKGDFVVVVDERHGKPIALGEAVYGSGEISAVKHGVVVRTVHFVGDKTWNFIKKLEAKG
jgi:PUA domain protein